MKETLARHEKILMDLAKHQDYHVGAIYKEVVSGETISARPVMQQLLQEVENGMWDGVLVVEVERLARGDTIDQGVVSRAFQYSDTKIITPSKIYDPNNEFDEEYFEFGLFMSRREYKTIKRRLNSGRISSVNEGKYCGNKPPYGYERIKLSKEKGFTLKPVPAQAETVNLIYNWYVYGIDGSRLGISKIVRKLNALGIPALNRKDWVDSSISSILTNPVYIGKIRWNYRKNVKKIEDGNIITMRPRNEDYMLTEGLHPAIIPEELYYKAQELRRKNPPRPISIGHTIKNPLSGIVYCKKCGRAMSRRPYSKSGQADTLLCPYTSCSTVSSKLALVEKAIILGLEDLVKDYKLNDTLKPEQSSAAIESKEVLLSEKYEELKRLSEQKMKQFDFLEQGIYTTEIFLARSELTAKQIQKCSAAIESLKSELEHDRQLFNQRSNFIPKCENMLSNYWDWDAATRNEVLKELLEKVVYAKDVKNTFGKGDDITFTLDIYPRIQ